MLNRFLLLLWVALPGWCLAQTPLFDRVAPAGALVYTDLKQAAREPAQVYRMHLSGPLVEKQLRVLPKLSALRALKLESNGCTQLPVGFLRLPSLLYLRSEGNAFTTFSDSLPLPPALRYVELAGTAFDTLPAAFGQLQGLTALSIAKNSDTLHFPATLGNLTRSLTEFSLLGTLTDSTLRRITSCTRLQRLTLYGCGLTALPKGMNQLQALQELNLTGNYLGQLPREVMQLTQLKRLILRDNQLLHINSRICFLTNLELLDLRGNPISSYEVECLRVLLPRCDILF